MNRPFKFRVPNYNDSDGSFSHFAYWGAIEYKGNPITDHSSFTSPGNNTKCTKGWHEQFTERLDDCGTEIYENDIVTASYRKGKGVITGLVEWDNDSTEFVVIEKSNWMPLGTLEAIAVTGNKYQSA